MVFSYFGSKSKIIHKYPRPKFNTIIEPFCGSARYALKYRVRHNVENDVWLNDKNPIIYSIWLYIQRASLKDIMSLPELGQGENLKDIKYLCEEERYLLGFCVGRGRVSVSYIVTEWSAKNNEIRLLKNRLCELVGKIDHWKVTNLDFRQVRVDYSATYFVDPPYQFARTPYVVKNGPNFYNQLAGYCRRRKGQVIVCEGEGADWMQFDPLTNMYTSCQRNSTEYICELFND